MQTVARAGQSNRRTTTWRALVLVLAVAVSGCLDDHRTGFYVINRLDVPVDVTFMLATSPVTLVQGLVPGNSLMVNRFVTGSECRSEGLVATDQTGTVLATFPGPICNQTTWEIGLPLPSH